MMHLELKPDYVSRNLVMSLYPASPEGVSVDANMSMIRRRFGRIVGPSDYHWFYEQVRNKGPWDFKKNGNRQFENFGNFHYGAVGYAGGIPETVLLRAAGFAQSRAGTHDEKWGDWYSSEPFGDDPKDQEWIKKGIEYAKNRGY
jgi:hypothetical protein